MNYPENWQKLFDYHWGVIRNGNVDVFNEKTYDPNQKFLSLIFKMPEDVGSEVATKISELIPANLKDRMIFPDPKSYHFTLQWAPDAAQNTFSKQETINLLESAFQHSPPIEGDLHFPFFGRANLFGMLETKKRGLDLKELRVQLQKLWDAEEIQLGINTDSYELAWTSLVRFNGVFNDEEKLTLKNLPALLIPDIALTEVSMVINDKMNQPQYSRTIHQFKLG